MKAENKVKAGYARSEKYHERNLEQFKKELFELFPDTMTLKIVEEMYKLFRQKFTFFKK